MLTSISHPPIRSRKNQQHHQPFLLTSLTQQECKIPGYRYIYKHLGHRPPLIPLRRPEPQTHKQQPGHRDTKEQQQDIHVREPGCCLHGRRAADGSWDGKAHLWAPAVTREHKVDEVSNNRFRVPARSARPQLTTPTQQRSPVNKTLTTLPATGTKETGNLFEVVGRALARPNPHELSDIHTPRYNRHIHTTMAGSDRQGDATLVLSDNSPSRSSLGVNQRSPSCLQFRPRSSCVPIQRGQDSPAPRRCCRRWRRQDGVACKRSERLAARLHNHGGRARQRGRVRLHGHEEIVAL